jgi:putative membrane protein
MPKYQKIILLTLVVATLWSVINPYSYGDWVLEMLPVFLATPIFIFFAKRYNLSAVSYILVALFLLLGIVEAHYSIARVPFGFTLGEWFGTSRNTFDRLMHFLFGALIFYPLYELTKRLIINRKFFHYFIPSAIILAFSAIYEVAEWGSHTITTAGVSKLFLGVQGDRWDSQKDMALAALGTLIALLVTVVYSSKNKKIES